VKKTNSPFTEKKELSPAQPVLIKKKEKQQKKGKNLPALAKGERDNLGVAIGRADYHKKSGGSHSCVGVRTNNLFVLERKGASSPQKKNDEE